MGNRKPGCKFRGNNEYYERSLISGDTLEEISEKHEALLGNPFYDSKLKASLMDALFQESNINSARLEDDLMKGRDSHKYYSGRIPRKIVERAARKIGLQVTEAWMTGLATYNGVVDENLILEVGHLVDPISNKERRIRHTSARVGNGISAVSPESLRPPIPIPGYEGHLDRFLREINSDSVFFTRKTESSVPITPVEKAVYSHFMNFYLQPNMDGNKRTGRIIQNIILSRDGLPPPIIYSSENREYTNLLVNAFEQRRIRDGNPLPNSLISGEEHEFFEYMGRKIIISLDKVRDMLDSKKTFYVNIVSPSDNAPLYRSSKKSLGNLMRRRDSAGFVHYKKKDACLIVRGNIELEEIAAVMDSNHNIHNFRINPDK